MESYLHSLGMYVWKSVKDGYEFPKVADESEENGDISTSRMEPIDPKNRK